jgi:6-phosphogluconolactonase
MKLKLILTAAVAGVTACLLGSAAVAQAAPFAYVTNGLSGNVSQYAIDPVGGLSPLNPATVPAGSSPNGVAITPNGMSAYVANADGTVSQYDIDPSSGALSPKTPATVAAGFSPVSVVVSPDGRSAYVKNQASDTVLDCGNNTTETSGTVSEYNIDPLTGRLSPKAPASIITGGGTGNIALTPDGKSAYVPGGCPGAGAPTGLWQYDIDPSTGVLSHKTPATVASAGATGVAVTPDGRSAYATNLTMMPSISQYDIDPSSGALSPKSPASFATVSFPLAVVVNTDGRSAYVAAGGGVSQFSIEPATGALSPKTPPIVEAGGGTVAVAVSPDAESVYAANGFGNTVSQYTVDGSTGALSPKDPATVSAGEGPDGIAVGPAVPTSKAQCKNGGWRNFPQFKNQGQCIAFVNHGP